jgi:hypothetical protein
MVGQAVGDVAAPQAMFPRYGMKQMDFRPLTADELAAFEDELADRAREIARLGPVGRAPDDTAEHKSLGPDDSTHESPALGAG